MPSLASVAALELSKLRASRTDLLPPLLEWIPRISPQYKPPHHLRPLIDVLSGWRTKPFRVLFSVPPRHGKTETLLHFFGWALRQDPLRTHAYVTYATKLADKKSRKGLLYTEAAGVDLTRATLDEWRTPQGGGVLFSSIGGQLTGEGVDGVAIVDDPVKDRAEAESATYRERAKDWFTDVLNTRLQVGASCLVCATRWHVDDLLGWLAREHSDTWTVINLPALSEDAEERPLWPEVWPKSELLQKKAQGEYTWASLFQGRPRPRGGTLFGDPHLWTELPKVFRVARGLDLAYTAKTSSDWSVLVTALVSKNDAHEDVFHIVDVVRRQKRAPDFRTDMRRAIEHKWPSTPIWIYRANGPEAGAVDLLRHGDEGVEQIVGMPAVADKFVRAQGYAAAWNAGRVLLPEDSERFPWVNDFISEHVNFTGVSDPNDDQVDAGAAMHDSAAKRVTDEAIETAKPIARRRKGLAGMGM